MIKGIFFDLGGVILHRDAMYRRSLEAFAPADENLYWDLYNAEALPLCRGEIDRREFWRRISDRLATPLPADTLHALCSERFQDGRSVDAEVIEIIRSLRGRYRLGVISNISEDFAAVIEGLGLLEHFDHVTFSCRVGLTKDGPEIFRLALAGLGVEAGEAIFIDDFGKYAEVAGAVGMRAIVFTDAPSLRGRLAELGVEVLIAKTVKPGNPSLDYQASP